LRIIEISRFIGKEPSRWQAYINIKTRGKGQDEAKSK
jgi:hypothetical protein